MKYTLQQYEVLLAFINNELQRRPEDEFWRRMLAIFANNEKETTKKTNESNGKIPPSGLEKDQPGNS